MRTSEHFQVMPDVTIVFRDGAVRGEIAAVGGVQDAHAEPTLTVPVGDIDLLLRVDVAAEIRGGHPGIMGVADREDDLVKDARLEPVEVAGLQQAHDLEKRRVAGDDAVRVIVGAP
jgi:hypothetical protein